MWRVTRIVRYHALVVVWLFMLCACRGAVAQQTDDADDDAKGWTLGVDVTQFAIVLIVILSLACMYLYRKYYLCVTVTPAMKKKLEAQRKQLSKPIKPVPQVGSVRLSRNNSMDIQSFANVDVVPMPNAMDAELGGNLRAVQLYYGHLERQESERSTESPLPGSDDEQPGDYRSPASDVSGKHMSHTGASRSVGVPIIEHGGRMSPELEETYKNMRGAHKRLDSRDVMSPHSDAIEYDSDMKHDEAPDSARKTPVSGARQSKGPSWLSASTPPPRRGFGHNGTPADDYDDR